MEYWNERIEELVNESGLKCYEQHFELVSCEDMLCYEAYFGMPVHYPHWVFGKAYERQRTFYQYNMVGLPYEMVINSDPCIAYLMRDNSLLLQIMTIAHVYAHNDFFKNNRLFKRDNRAKSAVERFKAHATRVRQYVQNPAVGPERVEKTLDAAHALRLQVARYGQRPTTDRKQLIDDKSVPERLSETLLGFLAEKSRLLEDWQRDILNIVQEETLYFIPQMETKIINEGWASYWHYQLLKELNLPQNMYWEFLKRHNLVVCPLEDRINPYYIGFKMFESLGKEYSLKEIFQIRNLERDQSFLRRFLTQELCSELHLFSYGTQGNNVVVKGVSDTDSWKNVRDDIINSVGLGGVPAIQPYDIDHDKLIIKHIYDGRELELAAAKETIKYVAELWAGPVDLLTQINNREIVVRCTEDNKVYIPIN